MLIDVTISEDRNVIKKEAEKIFKIQRTYNRNTAHVECKDKGDTSNRATGTTSKSFRKYVSNIPGNHEVSESQKTAILGTAHILRKVLT
jgi:hypothetical protein